MNSRLSSKTFLALLFSSALILMTCGGGQGRGETPPPPLILTIGSPLADTVVRSTFNAYVATVVPGSLYKISITDQTDDTDLLIFGADSSFSTLLKCSVDNTSIIGTSSEDCVIVAPSSTLYFGVDGTFLNGGSATYTIDIEQLATRSLILSIPLPDSKTQRSAAVYTVTVSQGVAYTIAITGLSDDADLHVFGNDNTFSGHALCSPDNTRFIGTTPEDCTLTSSGNTLYFIVDGIFSSMATVQYTALATPTPVIQQPANEGTVGSPITLSLNTPVPGQVANFGTSYYSVGSLNAGARYTLSILGLSANANMTVFGSDNSYANPVSCQNTNFMGTIPEDCTLQAPQTGTIYFTVTAKTTSGGVAYFNLIDPGP